MIERTAANPDTNTRSDTCSSAKLQQHNSTQSTTNKHPQPSSLTPSRHPHPQKQSLPSLLSPPHSDPHPSISQISVYGRKLAVDCSDQKSVMRFMQQIERCELLQKRTKVSILMIVLERGARGNRKLSKLLVDKLSEYEEFVLTNDFN